MNLSSYISEDFTTYEGIMFMEHRNTKHKVVVKRAEMEKGINEINAYKGMEDSPLLDFTIDTDGVVLMLHRYSGENLDRILQDSAKADDLAAHIDLVLDSALRFLKKLHSSGICHGSISPEKIIIDEDYSVKFVGYGYAGEITGAKKKSPHSIYTAPEIIFGGETDLRLADLYSLGRSLYRVALLKSCIDFDSLDRIFRLTSVIPEKRV